MGTVSVPSSTLCLISGVANGDIWFLDRKRPQAERAAMVTPLRESFCFFVMHIYGAKFQEQCFNISRDIVYSVFYHFSLQTI